MDDFGQHGWGMGWGWILGIIVLILLIWLIIRMLDRRGPSKGSEGSDSAMDILKKRYARGEITKEEFNNRKKDLG